jgi:leader peptidase (prepilin peptidase)/N-methyltransferase
MLGYRLVHDRPLLTKRSQCTHCDTIIAWYDNIPVISWILLRGTCRTCHQPISLLYPAIELLTVCAIYGVYTRVDPHYFIAYFIFVSALIVTVRSDLETMLISRIVTLYAIPVGFICSWLGLLPMSLTDSLVGTLFGYSIFWLIATLFQRITGKQGMGQGDSELLAFIGSFTGIIGCWATILISSITGSLVGILLLTLGKHGINTKLPFGPFLALGAFCYILWQQEIIVYLVGR